MSTEVTDQLRAGIERVPAQVPPGLARRAYSQYRRRRLAARAIAAAGTAAVAAIAATVVLSGSGGPAKPARLTTAYVVSRVTKALDTLPADTIMFTRTTYSPANTGNDPEDDWAGPGDRVRDQVFTPAGQLLSDSGWVLTGTTFETVSVHYWDKSWWRQTTAGPKTTSPSVPSTCATDDGPPSINPSAVSAWLRAEVSCGNLTATGTGTVDGVTAIELTGPLMYGGHPIKGKTPPKNLPEAIITYWVSPTTYLPVRFTLYRGPGIVVPQEDYEWLPPTAANLAMLNLPVPPAGFTQIAPDGCIYGCNP